MTTQSSYQVIARRWRPKQFDEIVGQEHIVRTLKNAIETGRIAHAYLFVGPRGTGKTTTARIFAKALNAEGGPNVAPDDNSEISKAILNGSCMDVIEIDGASNNGVEDVRQLREDVQYAPSQGNFKVYIIDEVHMLSNNAWNALLKTLEEPPAHVKFIFATTEAHKVLPTVVSRCQRFEFRPIPDAQIIGRLREIAEQENIEVEDAALASIARMADGGMRDAQSILDQLISFCGTQISEQNALDVYGLASSEDIEIIVRAMAAADYEALFAKIEALVADGRDLYRILLDIQTRVREALVEAIGAGGHSTALGTPMSAEALTRMLDAVQQGEEAVRAGLSQRVNFEVALLRAIDQSRSRAIDSVIKSLTQIAAGLPEDAGQKKIGTSVADRIDRIFAANGVGKPQPGSAGAKDAQSSASAGVDSSPSTTAAATDASQSVVATGGNTQQATTPGSATGFEPVSAPRRMVFPMLGGGTNPFDRPVPSPAGDWQAISGKPTKGGTRSATGNAATDAHSGRSSAADMFSAASGKAEVYTDSDPDDAFDTEVAPAYSPFSSSGEENTEDNWNRSLAQMDEGSEFITHPDDEGEEDSAYGSSTLSIASLTKASGVARAAAGTSLPAEQPIRTYGENAPEFQAALEKIPERARDALEGLLRVQYRHLEQRS